LANDSIFNSSYGNNPGVSKETDISIDYSDPLTKDISFETGTKAVLTDITSTSDVYLLDPEEDTYEYNAPQSSALDYKSNIYAAYLSTTFKLYNWLDVKVGARYEHTQINAYYSTAGDVYIQPYGILVPSAIFSHSFKDNQIFKITYSRRIQRPGYYNLNPFINASDPGNVTTGNTDLQPEISDKIELGYNKTFHKGGNTSLSLFYRESTHDIQSYTTYYPTYKIGDSTYNNVAVTQPENIGSEQDVGMNIYGSMPIKRSINLRSNISLFERDITTGLPTGGDISGFNYRLNLNGTYEINKTLTIEVFGNYNSARVNAQGTYPSFFSYNFAIRKKLFNEKASIAITANNPFNYYVSQTTNLSGENFALVNTQDIPYQSFGCNLTYKFGKLEFKNEKENESNPNASEEN
jgi:outer membrane receptor protein involved in Fe transport